ncbi:MAG TPA: hypothetical protein VK463_00170, partial [Desulfomonilaceae bacterium]|nr:hypothetical protein [Desulfomonilaceae bacterium]
MEHLPDSSWTSEKVIFFTVVSGIRRRDLVAVKRSAIKDSEGREIEPVIAVICEAVLDSSDMIQYYIRKRTQVGFDVKKVLTHQDGSLTCRNAVGYEGEYQKG